MITSKITQRGQTTVPRQIRNALGLKSGQQLVYEIKGDSVVMRAHPGALASFGALKRKPGSKKSGDKTARAQARAEWAEHAGREGLK